MSFFRNIRGLVRATVSVLALVLSLSVAGAAIADESPLMIAKQGSFFVGGETRTIAPGNDITVNQMYVQYQVPVSDASLPPVIMIHGCCLSSKSWEETPDGRMGWSEYFVRSGYPTYLIDQVTRARSGFDPTVIAQVRAGTAPPDALPNILTIGHQATWTAFRFGPNPGEAFPDTQFPVDDADEFYKQMIPDLNLMLGPYSGPNPTFNGLAELSAGLGGAVLIGHSESGFFPGATALINPDVVRAMILIEPGGSCTTANPLNVALTPAQIAVLAQVPTLVLYGDHLAGGFARSYDDCRNVYTPQIEAAGGDITFMSLPEMGIMGNSHMMMLDRNNLEIADLLIGWIQAHAR